LSHHNSSALLSESFSRYSLYKEYLYVVFTPIIYYAFSINLNNLD